jgi:hypothetical protein
MCIKHLAQITANIYWVFTKALCQAFFYIVSFNYLLKYDYLPVMEGPE